MSTATIDSLTPPSPALRALHLPRGRTARWLALAAVVALAAGLRFANLGALGYANHYYTAGVASMLQSWHNFFFVAAEPGGAVSIDKPPVGLWLQAISAYVLGVNGFAMVLPEIICGLLAVVVVYHLVRRYYGTAAGLLAGLALAITPIVVATDRNNTIDSSLILTLLLAAWAFIRATETGRLRYLLLGAGLVGIGFNIKMLQAYLPLPAFLAVYFLGAPVSIRRKLLNLTVSVVLLLVVSFSWVTVVDLTPADQRPYVGSSGDNTVLSLALGYNGLERLTGMGGTLNSLWSRLTRGGRFGSTPQIPPGLMPGVNAGGSFSPQGGSGRGQFGPGGPTGGFGGLGGPGGAGRLGPVGAGAFPGTGAPGLTRLFTPPLSKEASWLLPFSLVSLALLLVRGGFHWPIGRQQQTAVLWGGWLLTGAVFFSVAGFFHEYYLSMLAAPTAVLMAVGVAELWRLRAQKPWLALSLLLVAAALTLWFQLDTASEYLGLVWWLAVPLALLGVGALLLGLSTATRRRLTGLAGGLSVVGAMLFLPGVWSGLTTAFNATNQSLPAAYAGPTSGPANGGGLQVNVGLLDYLEANTQDVTYLMAVPSSMQGSDYVIATGRPVLYMGGFMGQDNVVTGADLQRLVQTGQLRFIYWDAGRNVVGSGGRGVGDQTGTNVSAWLVTNCKPVPGYETSTQNAGAPDGTGEARRPGQGPGRGAGLLVTLYDCGG